jgi:hypothetical protein
MSKEKDVKEEVKDSAPELTDDGRVKKVARNLSTVEMDQITRNTAALLAKMPKVRVRLRQNPPGEPQLPAETVQINGHTFMMMRGVDIEVPELVRDILVEANLI